MLIYWGLVNIRGGLAHLPSGRSTLLQMSHLCSHKNKKISITNEKKCISTVQSAVNVYVDSYRKAIFKNRLQKKISENKWISEKMRKKRVTDSDFNNCTTHARHCTFSRALSLASQNTHSEIINSRDILVLL